MDLAIHRERDCQNESDSVFSGPLLNFGFAYAIL